MKEEDYTKATNVRTLRIMLMCGRELLGMDGILEPGEVREINRLISLAEQKYEDKL